MAADEKNEGSATPPPAEDNSRPSDEEKGPGSQDTKQDASPETSDEQRDPNLVDWDGPDDPENPQNWTTKAQALNLSFVIFACLLTPLASSMFAPGVTAVLTTFSTQNSTVATFVVSIYILGFAVGPLIISPLSEIYGRYPVYLVCNVMFLIFTIACAVAGSIGQLIAFRFFAGAFGVAPVTLGGASISDLVPQEKRGVTMSLFGLGPLMGPVIGPLCGSYVSADIGWRWTFWIIAIAYAIVTIVHAAFCRETFAPVLLARKTARLQKSTDNPALRSKMDQGLTKKVKMQRAIVRPLKMLIFSPIVSLMAIYVALVYGILYLLYTTFTFVFQEYYAFSEANVGLVYIASGIGMLFGLILIGGASDRLLKSKAAKHGGEMKPEYRLVPLMYVAWLVPAGLFIYGWTVDARIQWAAPLFGTLLFGLGIIAAMICIQQYLIDAFTIYAASAVAANTVLRSIVGGLLPLAGLNMYDALGLGWGNSLLAFISLAMVPIPFAFYIFGERIRKATKVQL